MPPRKRPGKPGKPNPGKRPGKQEKRYWKEEGKRFERERPKAFLQSKLVRQIAKQLIPRMNAWRKAKARAANAWLQLENCMLGMRPGKVDATRFRELLDRAQRQSIKAVDAGHNFFSIRNLLMREWRGITDFYAQQKMLVLGYEGFSIGVERKFYGHVKMLANARLLKAFADLIARMRITKDNRYNELRRSIGDSTKAFAYSNSVLTNHLAEQRYAFDKGNITWKKYNIQVLARELASMQQRGNIARAEEALYSHLQRYATGKKLNSFLAMLVREKRAEKNHLKKKADRLEKEIAKGKGDKRKL